MGYFCKKEIIKRIFIVITITGIVIFGSLALFQQMRQLLISVGEMIAGRKINNDIWNQLIFRYALILLGLLSSFLLCLFEFRIPKILQENRKYISITTNIALICLYSCILFFLAL